MDPGSNLVQLLPVQLRRLPADLAAVVCFTIGTAATVFIPVVNQTPLRVVFGLPFVLFVPGYAFIAALFPEAGESPTDDEPSTAPEDTDNGRKEPDTADIPTGVSTTEQQVPADRAGIDGIERVALSFGTSIAIVPVIGLILNFTPWGIRLVPIMISLSAFTLGATAIAAKRRWALPAAERFTVPYHEWIAVSRRELFEPDTRADGALNVLLIISVLLAVFSVGYAVAVPKQGEQFTEFYLLTESDDGELVADDYPTSINMGDSAPIVVGIGNQEQQRTTYSVVAELQAVEAVNETNINITNRTSDISTELRVVDRQQIDRFSVTLNHNETWQDKREITPTLPGKNRRVQYLLYKGTVPTEPTEENAYRSLHLWIDVPQTDDQP